MGTARKVRENPAYWPRPPKILNSDPEWHAVVRRIVRGLVWDNERAPFHTFVIKAFFPPMDWETWKMLGGGLAFGDRTPAGISSL